MHSQFISLFILFAGYIIGLGAVTVIDIHGFLGRKSTYWTKATITTHKVTKPLIWFGTILVLIGSLWTTIQNGFMNIMLVYFFILFVLFLNGIFLSFWVSPMLLKRENQAKAPKLLPIPWLRAIFVSFIISFIGWWSSLAIIINYLLEKSII